MLADELNANLKGSDNAGDAMVLWAPTKDAFPEIQAFPSATNHELFTSLENIIIDRIARATKVPTVLANIQVSGKLGATQEIINAIYLMHHRVNKPQRFVESVIGLIVKNWNESISAEVTLENLNPITYIPDGFLDALTQQEKRDLIEVFTGKKLNPLPEEATTPQPDIKPQEGDKNAA